MNGYLQDINSGDPAGLAAHYAPDVMCENYCHRQAGGEVVVFLTWLGVWRKARMTTRQTGCDGDQIVQEADMSLADLPTRALRQGDIRAWRTFGIYIPMGVDPPCWSGGIGASQGGQSLK